MVKHWIHCCYCIPWVPIFWVICIKPQLNPFHFWRSFRSFRSSEVVRGHKKVKHWICCCYCIPGVPSFRLICIKPQLQHFHFWRSFRSLEVVRGHQKVKHWICCCYWIPWVPSFRLICIKPQLKYFLFVEVIRGHQRSLEVIKVQFDFVIGISNPNQACIQKIGRFEPKMKAGPPPTSNVPTPPSPFQEN